MENILVSQKFKYKAMAIKTAPYIGLVLTILVFQILTAGQLLTLGNIQNLTNQVIITALVAIGAVFLFGVGCFDISLGSFVTLTSVLGGMVAIRTGNLFLALIICMVVPIFMSLLKGLFAVYVEVPYFIFSIVLGLIINSLVLVFMGKETTLYLNDAVKEIPTFSFSQMTGINVMVLGLFLILAIFLFNHTPLGIRMKMIGGNFITARQSGMDTAKVRLIAFVLSAIGIGLASFLIIIRVRTVGYSTAVTTGNDVIVALVLGGMPISGGPRTRVSAGIVGAATITVLNSGLAIMGLSSGTIQLVRGIVFLAVVFVASFSYRTKMLPR